MSAPKLTAEETKEIVELFNSGTTCKEIAELYDRKYGTVWALLKREGLLKKDEPKEDKVLEKETPTFDRRRNLSTVDETVKPRNLHINRGEIYYIVKEPGRTLQEQEAGRPAIIISNNKCNLFSDYVEVVFLTTQAKKDLPTHAKIFSTGKKSTALCEKIQSIPKYRIAEYVCVCTDDEMKSVDAALADSIGLKLNETPAQTETQPELVATNNLTDCQNAVFERDTYKRLYEELLDKLVRR